MANPGFAQLKANNLKRELDRGRGQGPVFPYPLELEPPFTEFTHRIEPPKRGLGGLFNKPIPKPELQYKKISALNDLGVISLRPSKDEKLNLSQFEQFLLSLKLPYPLSFEIIGSKEKIIFQLVARQSDLALISSIFRTHFTQAEAVEQLDFLREVVAESQPTIAAYCLKESYLLPLKTNFKLDPYAVLLSHLNCLSKGMAALQVLFAPVKHNWADNMMLACRDEFDPTKSVFADLPELPKLVSNKVSQPLLAVSIRLIASSKQLLERLGSFLSQFKNEHNGFMRLKEAYPLDSLLNRTNHAPGMILNSFELAGLIHLPDSTNSVPKLAKARKTAPTPLLAQVSTGISLGENFYQGKANPVSLSQEWLTRHLAIFGGTGTGKTNLLGYLFSQLITQGGSAFIDPAGDASQEFLSLIPESHIDKVIYFDPINYPLSINPLEIKDKQQVEITTVNLLVAIKRLFDASAWGPRMEWILRKAIKTLLLAGNKTLLDIPWLLTDKNYRKQLLTSITDADLLNFWQTAFPKLSLHTLIPILDKLSVFLDSDIIKPIISNPRADIDFADILNNQKIFIANLSKGTLGEKNAHLLGSFIISAFQMAIMARAKLRPAQRKFFSLIIDEFHSYAEATNVSSINSLLSEARKYRVSLITATQFLGQVDRRIKDAILGNVGTLIALRVGLDDAHTLQKELGQFIDEDLLNLKVGQAIVRMGTAQDSFNLAIPLLEKPAIDCKAEILKLAESRKATLASAQATITTNTLKTTPTPTSPQSNHTKTNLPPEEKKLLKFLYQRTELLPFSKLAQEMNISSRQLYKLVDSLSQKGLVAETKLSLASSGRKAKLIIITSNGITALGHPAPQGKGGALHQYFQRIIKAYAQKRGYQVIIEKHLGGQKAVDLSLEKGDEKVAIEISITTEAAKEFLNLQKCLSADYDRIILLCSNESTLENLKKRIEQDCKPEEQAKLFLSPLNHFYRHI